MLARIPIAIAGPDGVLLATPGAHPNGHPLRALTWLARFLGGRAMTLRAASRRADAPQREARFPAHPA